MEKSEHSSLGKAKYCHLKTGPENAAGLERGPLVWLCEWGERDEAPLTSVGL